MKFYKMKCQQREEFHFLLISEYPRNICIIFIGWGEGGPNKLELTKFTRTHENIAYLCL